MYIYQAELIITVYRRLFSIDAENTENLYYTNPDMGFAGSLDLTVGHDTLCSYLTLDKSASWSLSFLSE